MAVKGFFYNSVKNDRPYNGEDMNEAQAPFYKEGVVYGHLAVTAGEGMTVNVDGGEKTGYAYINLHTIHNTTVLELQVSQAGGTLPRIDRVILRNDEAERKPSIFIQEGEYSFNPQPPKMTNTDMIQEKCLAEIYVAAGAVEITQADITDTRADPALCGYVASQFEDFDFSQFALQFNSWFHQKKTAIGDEYENFIREYEALKDAFINEQQEVIIGWFNKIKGQLSEDVGVSLQMQMNNKLDKNGDSKDNTITFESEDTEEDKSDDVEDEDTESKYPKGWTHMPLLESGKTHSTLLRRMCTAVKNLRYIGKLLGSTDIYKIGDGTVTGAIDSLNSKIANLESRLGGLTLRGVTQSEYDEAPHEDNHIYFVVPDKEELVIDSPQHLLPTGSMAVAVTLPKGQASESEVE